MLSVETATLHNKLKEVIREVNKIFADSKSNEDQRHFQELLAFITQYQGDIDLLMCQMQYEPKVKETILFAPVTTDILDRMNLILHSVRILAKKISTGDVNDEHNETQTVNDASPSSLPAKVTYIIKVKTNDHASSSLSDDTNVTVRLYGTHNKSPEIRLIQSINKVKWQAGQIDLFNIELTYLGEIYAMEIWHDSDYSSWKVDWVDIIDDAANLYRFPVDRLFDKHSDEKKARFVIQRDTGLVNRLPSKPMTQSKAYKQIGFSTYKVQVKTGKQPNKATDSSVFIQMKGENGTFAGKIQAKGWTTRTSDRSQFQITYAARIPPWKVLYLSLISLIRSILFGQIYRQSILYNCSFNRKVRTQRGSVSTSPWTIVKQESITSRKALVSRQGSVISLQIYCQSTVRWFQSGRSAGEKASDSVPGENK